MSEKIVLCGANSYEQKYYFNTNFEKLPENIKQELQVLCVTYTEEIGGVFTISFNEYGNLELMVQADDSDYLFDEIGSELKIKQIQIKNRDLFESLETFYKTFFKTSV